MSKIAIPFDGEAFLGDGPAVEKVYKVTFGFTGSGADVIVTAEATYELADLPAGFMITKVMGMVKTAFTAAVTLTIGDGDEAAGFLASADIAPQVDDDTAGIPCNSLLVAEAQSGGKKYAVADTLDVVVAGTPVLAGLMEVYICGYEEGYL